MTSEAGLSVEGRAASGEGRHGPDVSGHGFRKQAVPLDVGPEGRIRTVEARQRIGMRAIVRGMGEADSALGDIAERGAVDGMLVSGRRSFFEGVQNLQSTLYTEGDDDRDQKQRKKPGTGPRHSITLAEGVTRVK
jgi:hypothetical protein